MTYGLNPGLFIENGPAIRAAEAHSRSSADAFRAWRALDADRRLALVERALRVPANENSPDGFPVAL
jgi:hypothetical protein